MQTGIRLLVGLGNPGEKYQHTRHNAGAWFIEQLAQAHDVRLQLEPKFHGKVGSLTVGGEKVWLLLPTTFMNASGTAVRAMSQFYQLPAEAILVAHDELDFPAGLARLKQSGGHGGHNGLRDIMAHLQTAEFARLRIGIGHPGDRNQVLDYVLNRPSKDDCEKIIAVLQQTIALLPDLVSGNLQKATQQLHTA